MYQKKRRKRVRSRKESFDVSFSAYNTRYTKPRSFKDYEAPKYRYAFSENYKTLEKLIHDSKPFKSRKYLKFTFCSGKNPEQQR